MTIEKLNEITQNLTTVFGKGDHVYDMTYGWYYKTFSIYAGVDFDDDNGNFIPSLSMYYNPDSGFCEEEWDDATLLSKLDFKVFIDNYQPSPIKLKPVSVNLELQVPANINVNSLVISEAIKKYGIRKS